MLLEGDMHGEFLFPTPPRWAPSTIGETNGKERGLVLALNLNLTGRCDPVDTSIHKKNVEREAVRALRCSASDEWVFHPGRSDVGAFHVRAPPGSVDHLPTLYKC